MNWPTAPLGSLCTVVAGGTPSRSVTHYFDGGIPWVKISDMVQGTIFTTEETLSNAGLASSGAKLLEPGTLLLSIFATIGRTAVLGVAATSNQAIVGITPRANSQLDSTYLRRYLDSAVATLVGQARGAAQVNINSSILRAMQIPLPPLPEQRRIAAILDQADEVRAKRRRALTLLNELADATFRDLIARSLTANPTWPTLPLGEISRQQGGLQITRARLALPLEVPYLRVANVFRGVMDLSEIKTIRVTDAELERVRLQEHDLLLVEGHGNPKEVGRAARWVGDELNMVHQNHLIRVRVSATRLDPVYAERWLNSAMVSSHWSRVAKTTSGLNTINMGNVRAIPMLVPPLEVQHDLAAKLLSIQGLRARHHSHLAKLDELFVSLQHRAFAGQL